MRFLHTSDWHLGRSLHRVPMLAAQTAFLDHLITTVHRRQVDAVLVAGDIYDRAVPPLSAVELFDDALHRLAAAQVPTVMISGNHDSARRLGVGAGLIDRAGIHLRTDPTGCATPVLLSDAHGEIACYGLPYLEPALVKDEFKAGKAHHEAVLTAAMGRVRADLATRAAGTRSIVLAHAFVAGGQESDSERDITVGGVAAVPSGIFHGIDYTALGHLHGCQTITDRVRYSGSPLAYSFSESTHRKTMWLIDLDAHGGIHAERVDTPVPRPLARLRGTLDELLTDESLARHTGSFIEATLTDTARPIDPMARLTSRFPHTLSLLFEPERRTGDPAVRSYAQRLKGRADQQVAEDFVAHVRGGNEPDDRERAVLREAFDEVRVATAAQESGGVRVVPQRTSGAAHGGRQSSQDTGR